MPIASNRTGLGRIDSVGALLVFGLGTGAFLVLEIFIGATASDNQIASWAYTRSVIFVGASLSLLGVDQAIMRSFPSYRRAGRPLLFQLAAFSLAVGLIANVGPLEFGVIAMSVTVFGFAVAMAVSGAARAAYSITISQILVHGWKFVVAALIILSTYFGGVATTETILLVVACAWLALALLSCRSRFYEDDPAAPTLRDMRPIGTRFWAASIATTGLVYADQIILNVSATPAESSNYFRHVAIFSPLVLLAVGFGANVANPFLRSVAGSVDTPWKKLGKLYLALVVVALLCATILGLLAGQRIVFSDGAFQGSTAFLVVLLLAVRALYLAPSAVVGVYGTRDQLTAIVAVSLLSIPIFVFLYLTLNTLGMSPENAMLVSLIVGGTLRLLWAGVYMVKIATGVAPLKLSL